MPEFDSTIEYRDVPGFPGYKVGNDGSVWSCWTFGKNGRLANRWRQLRQALKIHKRSKRRAFSVVLRRNRQSHHLCVSRVVLTAFVGPCPPGFECAHENGNSLDDCLTNLMWKSPKENAADKKKHGTHLVGDQNPATKLTDAQVVALRDDFKVMVGGSKASRYRILAARYGISASHIKTLIRGKVRPARERTS